MLGVRTPFYRIVVDGDDLSDDIYAKITKVAFKEPEDGEQYFTISMKDHDFAIQDSGLFVADKTTCSLYMGYVDDYDLMMDGIVQVIAPDFPQSDAPTLEITVKNISAVMNREEKNVRYINKTYSAVVIDIATRYGLRYDVDDTTYLYNPAPKKIVTQVAVPADLKVGGKAKMNGYLYASSYGEGRGQHRNQEVTITRIVDTSRKAPYLVNGVLGWVQRADLTPLDSGGSTETVEEIPVEGIYQTGKSDYEFCRAMAKKIGYKFYIDCATLYFKKKIKLNEIELEYRVGECNLLQFKPNINTTNTGNSFSGANIDFTKQEEIAEVGATQEAAPAPASTGKVHVVKKGEYLIKIAKQYYGDGSRYKEIYNANTDKVKMPGYVIYTGSKLTIP